MLTIVDLLNCLHTIFTFCFDTVMKKMVIYYTTESQSDGSIIPVLDLKHRNWLTFFFKPVYFNGSYARQNWSLPDSMIYYIMKNPSTPKIQQKMVQTCKYFYAKNRIVVVQSLYFNCKIKQWQISLDNAKKFIEFNKKTKFWVTDLLDNNVKDTPSNHISSIIPYLFQVDVTTLKLNKQVLTFNEFMFLSSKVEYIVLNECTVMKEDGSTLALEELVACLPKIKHFQLIDNFSTIVTEDTVAKLLKTPHFSNITKFKLMNISEKFDVETFFAYLKKHKCTKFALWCGTISQAYKQHLEAIVDEVLETRNHDYKTPYIYFNGITGTKYLKISSLYHC